VSFPCGKTKDKHPHHRIFQRKGKNCSWCPSFCQCMIFHRFTESHELEGSLEGHVAQLPCNEQKHLQLDQVAQSPVSPDLECLQGRASTTSLDSVFQCFNTFIIKNFFLTSRINLSSCSLKLFQLPGVTDCHGVCPFLSYSPPLDM